MSSIDEVIARSRQAGGFSERKQFTLARSRAIQKMREFALADPHFYILELIQSAVANGATFIDITCQADTVSLSYIGGGYVEAELAQIFDFLFASKDDFEQGALRQLALGINALMMFEPKEIIIETGDGTLKGTTRVSIRGHEDMVEVGRPENALRGTYIRAVGLNRRKVRGRSNLGSTELGPPECRAIEERCVTAPVPILVNSTPLFGYSSQRTPPSLFGFRRTVSFDEGDLYGTIGIAARPSGATFKMVTYGVWVQSVTREFPDGLQVGGVVAYDRLRKTADHAGIVQDGRFEEMWLRLIPYVNQLRGGDGSEAYNVTSLDGESLPARELIALLRDVGAAVFVPPATRTGTYTRERAEEIGRVMGAPVLCAAREEVDILRVILGNDARLVMPSLADPKEVAFYMQEEAAEPARPWLVAPIALTPIPVMDEEEADLSKMLHAEEDFQFSVLEAERLLGTKGAVRAAIYTPTEIQGSEQELHVQVKTSGRLVWEGSVHSVFPGHVLVIDYPDVSPSNLLTVQGKDSTVMGRSLVESIANVIARHAAPQLSRATQRVLEGLSYREVEPGTAASRIVLAAIARLAIKRLRIGEDGRPHITFSVVDPGVSSEVLNIPVFQTLTGRHVSMRELETMIAAQGGLAYGTVPEVPASLAGLDQDRILALDLHDERMLVALVGDGAYVRIDQREVHAMVGQVVCCDIALGLKEYPRFPLLVDEADTTLFADDVSSSSPEEVRRRDEKAQEVARALVSDLVAQIHDRRSSADAREDRRHAVRHLQWFLVQRELHWPNWPTYGVDELRLFATLDGARQGRSSYQRIRQAMAAGHEVRVFDGRTGDLEVDEAVSWTEGSVDLLMNPFVVELLSQVGKIEALADYDLNEGEWAHGGAAAAPAAESTAFLERFVIEDEVIEGVVGIPVQAVDVPRVIVAEHGRDNVRFIEDVGREYGIVGLVRLRDTHAPREVVAKSLAGVGRTLLTRLMGRLPTLSPRANAVLYERVAGVLFDYAGGRLSLWRRPDGIVVADVWDPLAQEILDLPVFPGRGGIPVSAQRLVREFQNAASSGMFGPDGSQGADWASGLLNEETPDVLRQWVGLHLCARRLGSGRVYLDEDLELGIAAGAQSAGALAPARGETLDHDGLAFSLEYWIQRLRPDLDEDEWASRRSNHVTVSMGDLSVFDPTGEGKVMAPMRFWNRTNNGTAGLSVYHDHWLVRWCLEEDQPNGRALAWLLMASYAHINAILRPVTNQHELVFQQRVAETLREGRLTFQTRPPTTKS